MNCESTGKVPITYTESTMKNSESTEKVMSKSWGTIRKEIGRKKVTRMYLGEYYESAGKNPKSARKVQGSKLKDLGKYKIITVKLRGKLKGPGN